MLQNIKPRKYQEAILATAKKHNTLVVLPTGMGKTLIALMLAIERSKEHPGSKILFLAPTRPLAAQHLEYFRKHLSELFAQLELFTGKVKSVQREKLWQKADIIFSTPQCIANDLKNGKISINDVSLLIEDEAHRCLKSYDYVYVAEQYMKQAEHPRILGMTASPGSKSQVIKDVCRNLGIDAVEARTRESEDVKPYLQKLEIELVKVELPEEFKKIRGLFHEIFRKRVEELKNRKLLFQLPMKKNLIELQRRIMRSIASGNKNFNMLRGASVCAQAIKMQHALELLETQTLSSLDKYMNELFSQARQEKSKGVQQLVKQNEFSQANILVTELITLKKEHPKLGRLYGIIEKEMKTNPKSRIIVFSHYRGTAAAICRGLNKINGVNARVFMGQAMKDGEGLSQREQQSIIHDFKLGIINILCATSIGEEGLDLPEVNAVVFYEPIPSAIRKIQRAGRTARLMPGKLVILMTSKTRDEAYHWAAFHKEKKMHGILKGMTENFKKNNSKEKGKQKGIQDFT